MESSLEGNPSFVEGPFKKTVLFGMKKQVEDLTRFEWPTIEDIRKMDLD